jgi:eukaryotic-like serine/threonine-protein kinase
MSDAAPWPAVKALFEALLDGPPAERAVLLAAAPAAVAREAEALLRQHEAEEGAGGRFLTPQPLPWAAGLPEPDRRTRRAAGERVGAWRLAAPLGEGGMGEVWLAERADGSYQGQSAIKLLRAGLAGAQVLERFALERQALARLSHPHIARLLDAGVDAEGAPYFVLEYVDGQPIHHAVRGRTLEERLALFLQLADAVAHAHRNLLVHRDLKPSNVLVNGDGQVKLLDFGIAKALAPAEPVSGADAAAGGGTTLFGQRPFTPSHASPEQVRGEPVSTATDIYSLGVLLYQMLTGTRPTGRGLTAPAALARSVLEDEPTRPSRLSAAEANDPDWPRTRRRLEGDLDNILLKALEKPPERRYASVDAMAADVRAYLDGRPVSARAASAAYLTAKFVHRHRALVLAAALGVIGLAGGVAAALLRGQWAIVLGTLGLGAGLVLALVQAQNAARARDAAQARFDDLRQLARAVLLDYDRLIEPLVGSTPVRRRLVSDAIAYLDRLARAAPDDQRLRLEMGVAYRTVGTVQFNGFGRPHLGDRAGAMRSCARAVELLEPLAAARPGDDEPAYELALALSARAGIWASEGDMARAAPAFEQAAALFTRHLEPDRADLRHRLELARTHLRLAGGWMNGYDAAGALGAVGAAEEQLRQMARLQPAHAELDHVWVWVHAVAMRALRCAGDWPALAQRADAAALILERLLQREPDNGRFLEDRMHMHSWRMLAAGELGDLDTVRREGARAEAGFRSLAARDEEDRNARRNLHSLLLQRAQALARTGATGATGATSAAEAALAELQALEPELAQAQARWPDDVRIEALLRLGRAAAAAQVLAEARAWADATPPPFGPGEPQWPLAALALRYAEAALLLHRSAAAEADPAQRELARDALQAVVDERARLRAAGTLVNTPLVWRSERAERELAALGSR